MKKDTTTDTLVEDQVALEDLCKTMQGCNALMIDTEFMRRNTYYAQLCLVQVACGDMVACIDVLQCESMEPLRALLFASECTKVMHACRQDVEVLHQIYGTPPAPLFDTQIAACACNYGEQTGYAFMVKELLGVDLDKSSTVTNWSKRPLSESQIKYAFDDVRYMQPLYQQLHARLESCGRLSWVQEDCARLSDASRYDDNPTNAWRRLNGAALAPAHQQVLQRLATWRETVAQRANRPREWIMPNATLYEISRVAPRTVDALAALDIVPSRTLQRHARDLIRHITDALDNEATPLWPAYSPLEKRREFKERLAKAKTLLDNRCNEQEVSSPWVASRGELHKLLQGVRDIPLLSGWRWAVAGEYLMHALHLQ